MDANIGQLIGVLLGAAVAWWGYWLRERKERKAALGVALSDLLDVRHGLVGVDHVVHLVKKEAGADLPEEILPHLRMLMESVISRNDDLNARYDKAITLLAGIDPLTAYELRSKNKFPEYIKSIRSMLIAQGFNLRELERFESELRRVVIPLHDAAIISLAKMYSWKAGRRVKALLQSDPSLLPELADLLRSFRPKDASNGKHEG